MDGAASLREHRAGCMARSAKPLTVRAMAMREQTYIAVIRSSFEPKS
jgi:hypothetical protein